MTGLGNLKGEKQDTNSHYLVLPPEGKRRSLFKGVLHLCGSDQQEVDAFRQILKEEKEALEHSLEQFLDMNACAKCGNDVHFPPDSDKV